MSLRPAGEVCIFVINRTAGSVEEWRDEDFTGTKRQTSVTPTPTLTIGDATYALRSVVAHEGDDPHKGHYVTFIVNSKTKKVLCYDDRECMEEPTLPIEAYTNSKILVYQRVASLGRVDTILLSGPRSDTAEASLRSASGSLLSEFLHT